jgi:hypothetical protein
LSKSADVEWVIINGGNSWYAYAESNNKLYRQFLIGRSSIDNLATYIHEINECEITELFMEMGIEEPFERPLQIKLTKKLIKKYPQFELYQTKTNLLDLSHFISPYGIGNCVMSRNKNRVFW